MNNAQMSGHHKLKQNWQNNLTIIQWNKAETTYWTKDETVRLCMEDAIFF